MRHATATGLLLFFLGGGFAVLSLPAHMALARGAPEEPAMQVASPRIPDLSPDPLQSLADVNTLSANNSPLQKPSQFPAHHEPPGKVPHQGSALYVARSGGTGNTALTNLRPSRPSQPAAPEGKNTRPQGIMVPSVSAPKLLAPLMGIPYRPDGATTSNGEYTTFANPEQRFTTPGLNCSGFVLEACRILLGKPISLKEAAFDRLGDSGPGSPHGEDWDFGWDIICNLSQDIPSYFLHPEGTTSDPATLTGFTARGYDFHAPGQLDALLERLRPDHLYLVSFNRVMARKPGIPQHYHVGIIVMDDKGHPLLYQTTTQRKKSYVRNLSTDLERKRFLAAFANTRFSKKHMAVIEVPMK